MGLRKRKEEERLDCEEGEKEEEAKKPGTGRV